MEEKNSTNGKFSSIWSFLPFEVGKHCIKHRNFTYFSGMEILFKDTGSAEFWAIRPNSAEIVFFNKISTPEN